MPSKPPSDPTPSPDPPVFMQPVLKYIPQTGSGEFTVSMKAPAVAPPPSAAAQRGAAPAPGAAAPARVILLNIRTASKILGSTARWLILQELARGEALPVQYLAGVARTERTATSKHMSILLKAGLVEVTFGRLYRLAPPYRVCVPRGYIDLGPCHIVIAPAKPR